MKFQEGSVVYLRGGSPPLTVTGEERQQATSVADPGVVLISFIWFARDNVLMASQCPESCLSLQQENIY